jgi:hypothetical protein
MTKSETPRNEFDKAFWNDATAPMIREEPSDKHVYDLEERTARFGEAVIDFAKIPQSAVTNRIVNQLVGAGTSVGTCNRETREAKHFLRMAVRAVPELKPEARKLWMEARELHLIFSKIWRSGKNEQQNRSNE